MTPETHSRRIVYLLFFLSGASGLIYEIIWARKLTLVFGGTVYAVTTVLTVFFTGLALGALLIGRTLDRGRDPRLTYVVLEILVGLFGISSPWLFRGIEALYFFLHPHAAGSLGTLTAVRFLLSFLGLLLPTTLMGATLPVLVKLVAQRDEEVAPHAGRLYAANTLGAACGTILATIFLIPWMGVNGGLYLAGAINLGVGALAYGLFPSRPTEIVPLRTEPHRHSAEQKYLLAIFGVVGFISMVYQVGWIRLLIQVTGSTVYTFGLMLSVFIVGVGLGSAIATRFLPRLRSVVLALVWVEIAASVYTLFATSAYDRLPSLFAGLSGNLFDMAGERFAFGALLTIKLLINAIVLLFPTLMFGAAFPLVTAIYARRADGSGRDVGRVYAVNTVGGIFGSFLGGFVFLPALGAQATLMVMGLAGLVVAVWIAVAFTERPYTIAVPVSCVLLLALAGLFYRPWDRLLIDSGPYTLRYPDVQSLVAANAGKRLLYYEEGVNVNVSVTGTLEPTTITINGKPMASTILTDVANQYMLGHLPMLLHPDPRSSMVIGLGAGMTFSALVRHGQPADGIEISPEVVGGTRLFAKYNRSVLDQPNANLIFDDGRNYLKTTRKRYDVITEDPLDPFFMGSGHLYDLEHFQNARRALNPGGVMCQYLPLYQMGVVEARIITKTFHAVFPYVTVWFAFNDIILIGTEEPLKIDLERLQARMSRPEIARDLRESGVDNVFDLLANYLFDQRSIPHLGRDLPLNTDDYPIIEFATPRAIVHGSRGANVAYFVGLREPGFPDVVETALLSPGGAERFRALQPRYYAARGHVMQAHLGTLGQASANPLEEIARAERIVEPEPIASFYIADIFLQVAEDQLAQAGPARALAFFERADARRPAFPPILNRYGVTRLRAGDTERGLELLRRSLDIEAAQVVPRPYLADDFIERGEPSRAKAMIEGCLELEPRHPQCLSSRVRLGYQLAQAAMARLDAVLGRPAERRSDAIDVLAALRSVKQQLSSAVSAEAELTTVLREDLSQLSARGFRVGAEAAETQYQARSAFAEAYLDYVDRNVGAWSFAEQHWEAIASGSVSESGEYARLTAQARQASEAKDRALARYQEFLRSSGPPSVPSGS